MMVGSAPWTSVCVGTLSRGWDRLKAELLPSDGSLVHQAGLSHVFSVVEQAVDSSAPPATKVHTHTMAFIERSFPS